MGRHRLSRSGESPGLDDYGAGHLEVQVETPGFPRRFVFDGHELEAEKVPGMNGTRLSESLRQQKSYA
jgi:hypothetical protein